MALGQGTTVRVDGNLVNWEQYVLNEALSFATAGIVYALTLDATKAAFGFLGTVLALAPLIFGALSTGTPVWCVTNAVCDVP